MNTRLLRRVAKHIAEEPKRLAMCYWRQSAKEQSKVAETVWERGSAVPALRTEHDFAPCGTAACIAGWTAILTKARVRHGMDEGDVAEKKLEITYEQGERLFHVSNWPKLFYGRFIEAKTPAKRARIAVARIEHFIKTKGKE